MPHTEDELLRASQCFDDVASGDGEPLPLKRCPTCSNLVPGHYLPTMPCATCVLLGPDILARWRNWQFSAHHPKESYDEWTARMKQEAGL